MKWQRGGLPLHPSRGGANILPLLLVVLEKRGGLVLTHKSRLSLLPTSHNLLLVCTCEMIGGAPPTRDTNLWHNITHIMDIEDISCYSFRVRNMIAMQMAIPAAAPPPRAGCVCCLRRRHVLCAWLVLHCGLWVRPSALEVFLLPLFTTGGAVHTLRLKLFKGTRSFSTTRWVFLQFIDL